MDQAAEVAVSAEQPPLYDTLILPTIDLSAILDSSSSSTNDDNRRNTNGGGGRELNTPTMDMEEEDEEVKDLPENHFIHGLFGNNLHHVHCDKLTINVYHELRFWKMLLLAWAEWRLQFCPSAKGNLQGSM